MRRFRIVPRVAVKPAAAAAVLAALVLGAGGAYVAFAARGPSKPRIVSGPGDPTRQTSAAFAYTHSPAAGFECSLDGSAFAACGSGTSGTRSHPGPLADGTHRFRVRAEVGDATSGAAEWTWTVDTAPPPAPTIDAHPADPTAATGATFAYGVPAPGAGYRCSLDGAGFRPCGRVRSYDHLPLGGHTFRVKAVDRVGNVGPIAAFVWTIVAPAPRRPRITAGPNDPTSQSAASFAYADSGWVSFRCSLDGAAYAACGSGTNGARAYPGPLVEGGHTFRVVATRAGSLPSLPDVWRWTVDRTPPPAPTFGKTPDGQTSDTAAAFRYRDDEKGSSFRCRLDVGPYVPCGARITYIGLGQGSHTFCVRALDAAGNAGPPACFTWQIGAGSLDFSIAGSPLPGALLYPGAAPVPVNLVITNPNASPITVESVTVSVTGTSAGGCSPASFSVAQQLAATPTVPASSTRSLQDLGVPQSAWPQLQMTSSGDQNACQNATVNLSFTGTATG